MRSLFIVIHATIDGSRLLYEAYTADDQLYDYFEMLKGANGFKSVSRGERQTISERRFATTGEFDNAPPLQKSTRILEQTANSKNHNR